MAYAAMHNLPLPDWAAQHFIDQQRLAAEAAHNNHYVNHPLSDNQLGGRGSNKGLAGNGNDSTPGNKIENKNSSSGDSKEANYLRMGDKVHLHDGSEAILLPYPRGPLEDGVLRLITSEGGAVGATTLFAGETPAEAKERAEREHLEEVERCRKFIPEFKPAREVLPVGCRWAQVVGQAMNPLLKRVRFEDNGKEEGLWVTIRQNAKGMGDRGKWVAVVWSDDVDNGKGGWKIWIR